MVIAVLTITMPIAFDQKLLIMPKGENKTQKRTFTKKIEKKSYEQCQQYPFLVVLPLIYE